MESNHSTPNSAPRHAHSVPHSAVFKPIQHLDNYDIVFVLPSFC